MNKEEKGYDLETNEFLSLSLFCNLSKNIQFNVTKIMFSNETSVFLRK